MNIVQIAQLTGAISILLLFLLKFYIVTVDSAWKKSGRIAMLWTCIYVFFLAIVRVFSVLQLASLDQLRIITGFSSLIPLLAVIIHLLLIKKADEHNVVI